MDNAKAKPCADCGVQYPSYVMEFDHLGDEPKEFDVCKGRFTSVERLMAEIAKCAVVCANCHRVRTWKRRQAAYAIERVG